MNRGRLWSLPLPARTRGGVPGFQGCQVPVTNDGRLIGADGEPLPIDERTRECGRDTTWCVGELHLCTEHFPVIADELDEDGSAGIEAAWREHIT